MKNSALRRRGAAMVMVIVLLALLLVLAVSFTFLMSQQEGTSVATLGGEQTRIITRTGADHAYARLSDRNRLREFERWQGLIPSDVTHEDNPFLDWHEESVIDLLADFEGYGGVAPMFPGLIDQDGNPTFRVEDPRRQVLGLNVYDETGKINLNFATPAAIGNLIGSSTLQGNVSESGGAYERIILEDASFLTPYDDIGQGTQFGGGYVVIDNQLFSYTSRQGNVLNYCVPNPPYNGADFVNALFVWRNPERELQQGEFVTTPTAYKIAYYRWLHALDGSTPALFSSLGDVRRIANMDRWFNPDAGKTTAVQGRFIDGWAEGMDPVTFQRLSELATTVSPSEHFDGGWCYPHVIHVGQMVPMRLSGKQILEVQYDDQYGVQQDYYVPQDPRRITNVQSNLAQWAGIGAGNLVRLRRIDGRNADGSGGETIMGFVISSTPGTPAVGNNPQQFGRLSICVRGDPQIDISSAWIIEVAERAAVNVNTAGYHTLAAAFHGVGPRGQDPANQPISWHNAYRIAGRIMDRTRSGDPADAFIGLNQLANYLASLSQETDPCITTQQVTFFMNQQRYPYATRGPGTVTVQFRYDSLDTYMVDAFATRYQPAGGVVARNGFREWVQIGSDRPATYSWFTHEQLADEMRVGQGNIMQLHPIGTVNSRAIGALELPYLYYLADERLVRGRLGNQPTAGPPQPWAQPARINVRNLAQDTPQRREKFYVPASIFSAQPNPNSAAYEAGDLESGMFSFWYRPLWSDHNSNHYIFDVAEQEYSNRMSMLWWGDRRRAHRMASSNSGLVFRIKDRTLQQAYTELRYELPPGQFRSNDWYHMTLNWKGNELSHVSLLLDGDSASSVGGQTVRPVVHHTVRNSNGAWLTLTTNLTQDLPVPIAGTPANTEIPIDAQDIDGFPDQGVIVIGSEAITYNGNNGYALQNIQRGARGTGMNFHPRGSKITVFGYTAPLRGWQTQDNANQPWRPRFPHLPATQGLLSDPLGNQAFHRVSKVGTNNSDYYRPAELGPDSGFAGANSPGGNPNVLPLASYAGLPERGVVAVVGVAWQGYFPPGTLGIPVGGVQYPRFEDDGDPATIPAQPARFPVPHNPAGDFQLEYVAYSGIGPDGLRVVARYDQNFNFKTPDTWYHFLGTFPPVGSGSELIMPSAPQGTPAYQAQVNVINFMAEGSVVMLVSIPVDSVTGYHNRSVVQIDDEWLFYNYVWNPDLPQDATGGTAPGADDNLFPALLFISSGLMRNQVTAAAFAGTSQPVAQAPWRGALGTAVAAHNASARVLPTFGTTVTTGPGDIITVVSGKNSQKKEDRIRQQRRLMDYRTQFVALGAGPGGWNVNPQEYICALSDHVTFDYQPNTITNPNNPNFPYTGSNLCKFPTGELPVELPTEWTFAGPDPRTLDAGAQGLSLTHTGDFDSFEFRQYNRGDFRLVTPMTDVIPANTDDVQVNTLLPPNMSVVRIDNELIAYRGTEIRQVTVTDPNTGQTFTYDTYWLLDITRGILGSMKEAHAGGTPIMNMASMRVGRPNAAGNVRTNRMQTTMGAETFKPYGFIRIEEENGNTEIMGYQRYQELQVADPNNPGQNIRTGNITSGVYNNPDDPQGLFRGAYGTRAIGYNTRALFFDQPVRFPDWFPGYHRVDEVQYGPFHTDERHGIPGAVSPEISHFQGSAAFRNATFHEFKWRIQFAPHADMSRHSNVIGARLVLRFKHQGTEMPCWGSVPTNRQGGLYAFDFDPGLANCRDMGSTLWEQTEDLTGGGASVGINAERVEWRVYFYFKQNAFAEENYKTSLQFQGADVTLTQWTRVLRHEEKR